MTRKEFESTLRSYGFEEDSEYKGCFHLKGTPIYTWYVDDPPNTMAINWGFEYTVYREITETRLIALYDLFSL